MTQTADAQLIPNASKSLLIVSMLANKVNLQFGFSIFCIYNQPVACSRQVQHKPASEQQLSTGRADYPTEWFSNLAQPITPASIIVSL